MPRSRNEVSRRRVLKAGILGAGLSLGSYLRLQAESGSPDDGRSAILVFLGGGPSHQDTFDLKPDEAVLSYTLRTAEKKFFTKISGVREKQSKNYPDRQER